MGSPVRTIGNVSGLLDQVDVPFISAPFTQITNRAPMLDLANDLSARMGVDRRIFQRLFPLYEELGPQGERVFGVVGDSEGAVRLVGDGWVNFFDTQGVGVVSSVVGNFIEITFYGTGLNLLLLRDGSPRDYEVSVDNGAPFTVTNTGAAVLSGKHYSTYIVTQVVTGLTLGLHTVRAKITTNANRQTYGYEVLNESSQINVRPGSAAIAGSKVAAPAAEQNVPYNSGFESGVLGTRGGHVLVYQKQDGTIGKAVQPAAGVEAFLASANHVTANEEMIGNYHWKQFGAGRPSADDFSTVGNSITTRGFVLDDNVTSLLCRDVRYQTNDGDKGLVFDQNTAFQQFTFVGTGLDIFIDSNRSGATSTYRIFVDGVEATPGAQLPTTIWGTPAGSPFGGIVPIVSGLPYGTHVVRIEVSTFLSNITIKNWLVYAPKKPALPAGAVELGDYFILGNFVANALQDVRAIAKGVLRKSITREIQFVNGTGGTQDWSTTFGAAGNGLTGWEANTDRLNASMALPFWGTGVELRWDGAANRSTAVALTINGLALTTANFPSAVFTTVGTGVAFNSGTGILNLSTSVTVASFSVSGLPLGTYTIKGTNNNAGQFFVMEAFDVITPIHAPKRNFPLIVHNTPVIGNQSIRDGRRVSSVAEEKLVAHSANITSTQTNSADYVPMQYLTCAFFAEKEAHYMVHASVNISAMSADGTIVSMVIHVDGVPQHGAYEFRRLNANSNTFVPMSFSHPIRLSKGQHTVQVFWRWRDTNATITADTANLVVVEA